jgi:hypothetical protein
MFIPPRLSLYVGILMLVFVPTLVQAQVNCGFKKYRNNKPLKAENQLTKALKKEDQKPVATLGLFYINDSPSKLKTAPYDYLQSRFQELQQAQQDFEALSPRKKLYYKKKKHINVKSSSFSISMAKLQRAALERIEVKDSLLLLDSFFFNMSPIHERLLDDYAVLEDTLVMRHFNSEDYETLRSIAKNHAHVLAKYDRRLTPSFYNRLLEAYVREHPIHSFRQFTSDFPFHWASRDCFTQDFLRVVESRSLQSMAHFLASCLMTDLDQVAMLAVLSPANSGWLSQKDNLSGHDLTIISELVNTADWIYNGKMAEDNMQIFLQKIKTALNIAAPSNRSYLLLISTLSYLRDIRAWDASLDLIQFAKPIFIDPQKQPEEICFLNTVRHNRSAAWFDAVIGYLSVPAEGSIAVWLDPINAGRDDYFPTVTVDDELLFYGQHWHQDKVEKANVYLSTREDSAFSQGVAIRPLSGPPLTMPLAVSADRSALLVKHNEDLCISYNKSGAWSAPVIIPATLPFAWVGTATLSPRGDVIIFEAANDPWPIQNEVNIDLYVSRYDKNEDAWSEAVLLGRNVNTDWQERMPHIHADNRTLLFSSAAHHSFANFDVFMSERLDSTWLNWSTPINLGKEVNSYRNDWVEKFSMPASGKKAYLVKPADQRAHRLDIMELTLPRYARLRRMLVAKGKLEGAPKDAKIKLGFLHPLDQTPFDTFYVQAGGHFQLLIEDQIADELTMFVDDLKVYSTIARIDITKKPDVYEVENPPITIPIKKMIAQEIPLPLEHVSFYEGSTDLTDTAKKELRWASRYFVDQPERVLLIGGYADGEGSTAEQEALSLARAEAVKAYLIEQGLQWDRLWTQGFADKKDIPKRTNDSKRQVAIWIK